MKTRWISSIQQNQNFSENYGNMDTSYLHESKKKQLKLLHYKQVFFLHWLIANGPHLRANSLSMFLSWFMNQLLKDRPSLFILFFTFLGTWDNLYSLPIRQISNIIIKSFDWFDLQVANLDWVHNSSNFVR